MRASPTSAIDHRIVSFTGLFSVFFNWTQLTTMFVSLNQSSNLIVQQGPFLAQNVCIRGLEGSAHFNLRDRVQCMEPPSELVSTYSTKKNTVSIHTENKWIQNSFFWNHFAPKIQFRWTCSFQQILLKESNRFMNDYMCKQWHTASSTAWFHSFFHYSIFFSFWEACFWNH